MNALRGILTDPAVTRLGLTLVHFLWQGVAAAAVAALALIALRKASASARYLALLAVLTLMAAAPVATYLFMSETPKLALPEVSITAAGVPITSGNPVALTHGGAAPPAKSATRPAHPVESSNPPVLPSLRALLPWVVPLWVAGVVLLSLRLIGRWRAVGQVRGASSEVVADRWRLTMDMLAQRLGVTRVVRLLESAAVQVPTVIGWLRPVILLPATALTGLTPEQWQAILAHELSHIRRNDYFVNLAQTVVETLLFYHPAVWWVSGRIRAERELCCDDLAVEACGDAVVYARALAGLEELRAAPEPALGVGGGSLVRRVRRLVGANRRKRTHLSARLAGVVALSAATAFLLALFAGAACRAPASTSVAARGTSTVTTELARSPWPKYRGNAQNTARGVRSGATGHVKWTFRTGAVVEGSPAIGPDGTVYVWSYDGYLYAIHASTGAMRWKATVGKRRTAIDPMTPAPLVLSNGTVVIGALDGSVYAIETGDGRVRWRSKVGDRITGPVAVGPEGLLYVPVWNEEPEWLTHIPRPANRGPQNSYLYALDSSTGKKRWKVPLGLGMVQASPAVGSDGTVYVGNNESGFCALDGRTGGTKWSVPIWAETTPAVGDTGDIYVGGSDRVPGRITSGKVYAVDGARGTIKWSSPAGGRVGVNQSIIGAPAIGLNDLVYFACSDGTLHAFRISDGGIQWEAALENANGAIPTPIVSSDGTVYAPIFEKGTSKLAAFDGTTGRRKWDVGVGSGLNRSAAIDTDGTIYIGSWQGDVYAIH